MEFQRNLTSLRKLSNNNFRDLSKLPESIGMYLPILYYIFIVFMSYHRSYLHNLNEYCLCSDSGDLISLEHLCIDGTAISTLPLSVKNLKKLKGLDLSSNEKLRHVPDYIQYLSGLKVIYLSSTKILSLPGTIGKLVNLSYIVPYHTERLKRLLDELHQLTNLQGISLQYSDISSLPNIEVLQSLEKLDLHYTQKLQALLDGIFVGLNIRKMDLSASSISSLPQVYWTPSKP
jgi:Leucine-rich repeat (LRR) protein